jgi:glyoxylase-like metal-dependent hydrolase (beta-lactamase superfamily II)
MHTPGHTSDSICLWHACSRTLLCADTLLGWGSTTVADLGDYMKSLEALRALEPQPLALLPGHGPPIVPLQPHQQGMTPQQLIDQYIDHRNARISQVGFPRRVRVVSTCRHNVPCSRGVCCRCYRQSKSYRHKAAAPQS